MHLFSHCGLLIKSEWARTYLGRQRSRLFTKAQISELIQDQAVVLPERQRCGARDENRRVYHTLVEFSQVLPGAIEIYTNMRRDCSTKLQLSASRHNLDICTRSDNLSDRIMKPYGLRLYVDKLPDDAIPITKYKYNKTTTYIYDDNKYISVHLLTT